MNTDQPTWVITGPTSGIGYRTALETACKSHFYLVPRRRPSIAYPPFLFSTSPAIFANWC